ncbi:MAG: DoxX family protein [Fulvivirga sp.]
MILTAVAFMYYGLTCLFSSHLKLEFQRFGMPKQRIITGVLQLLGACGLVVGLWSPVVGAMASSGLALLMLAGFIVRIKIRDSIVQTLPSFFFMALNAYLAFAFSLIV